MATDSPPNRLPDKINVYWDCETMKINKTANVSIALSALKSRLWSSIGFKLPIEITAYIRASKITQEIQNIFDINGIIQIQIPSNKLESVSKRLIVDITFCVYELERDKKSRAIAIISSDKDFGHLLSKIHLTPPISHLYLILLQNININDKQYLSNVVDEIIQLNCGNDQKSNVRSNLNHKKPEKPKKPKKPKKKKLKRDKTDNDKQGKLINITLQNSINYQLPELMPINIARDAKVTQIKKQIRSKYSSSQYSQCNVILKLREKELWNRKHLNLFNISNGDTLIWCWSKNDDDTKNDNNSSSNKGKKSKKKITIHFSELNTSNKFKLKQWKTVTDIVNVRQEVYQRNKHLNVQRSAFKLYYKRIELMDKMKISDYNLINGATIIWYTDGNNMNDEQSDDGKQTQNDHLSSGAYIKRKQNDENDIVTDKQQKIMLTMKKLDALTTFKVLCNKNAKIKSIKREIKKCQYIVGSIQIIVKYEGKTLSNTNKLNDCGICDGDTLSWDWTKKTKNTLTKITVKELRGNLTFSANLSKTAKIDDLKAFIRQNHIIYNNDKNIAKSKYGLILNGIELPSTGNLKDYKISNDDKILWFTNNSKRKRKSKNNDKMDLKENDDTILWAMNDQKTVRDEKMDNHTMMNIIDNIVNDNLLNATNVSNDIVTETLISIIIQAKDYESMICWFNLKLSPNTTIKNIKQKIRKTVVNKKNIEMIIKYKEKILEKNKTIQHYGICDGDTLIWNWRKQ